MKEAGTALTFEAQPIFACGYVDLKVPKSLRTGDQVWKDLQELLFKRGLLNTFEVNSNGRNLLDTCR
jgi:hypothetical protein